MAYPYLPVNPCCTDVVLNTPCGCSSTITNTGCNTNLCGTNLTASSTIVYDGPALTCTTAEPCDTLNVILQKIDEIICNLLSQINILTTQVGNINTQVLGLAVDVVNIYATLDVCCPVTTTTTTTACVVSINSQLWECTNLNVTTYRDGTPIPEVPDPVAWAALTTGAWCSYANDPANDAIYGKMYNWYAVNDVRGLTPIGFHVPDNTDWINLITFLGGEFSAGGELKETGTTHWTSPNVGATNSTLWTGLPGGYRYNDGLFSSIHDLGYWWASNQYDSSTAYIYGLDYNNSNTTAIGTLGNKKDGYSVRLLKD